ncbi:MAG: hypothetical protein K2N35_12780 [Muribaculaceae bacterium]|nr:hypothetical protein [Muribaculaceae bacterium]
MKDKFHIDHIRTLLHKYYEGETTPEEELNLEVFFRDIPECEIPEDLADDGRFFASIASLHPDVSEMEIPYGLFERISEISVSNDARHTVRTQRNQASRIAYILAAACACLIFTFGIKWMTNPTDIHTKTVDYVSKSAVKLPTPSSIASTEEETIPETSKTPGSFNAHNCQQSNTMAENAPEPNRLDDGFIEITDPMEAEEILREIGRLLASNTQKTNEAILHLEKTVDEYKEITKSILQ